MRLHQLIDQRDGRLFTFIEHVALRRWHVTITAMQPGTRYADETIPTIDLGVFRSRKAALAAANLVVRYWMWNGEDCPE
jgi:hypothetical protein